MTTSWTGPSVNLRNPSVATLPERSPAESRLDADFARIHQIAGLISSAAPLDQILGEISEFAAESAKAEFCTLYVVDGDDLVIRSERMRHPEAVNRVKVQAVLGATRWVPGVPQLVAVSQGASADSRVKVFFSDPVEARFESFVSIPMVSGGRLAGAISLCDRSAQAFAERAVEMIAMLGALAGGEIERLRLASENAQLSERLEARKIVERAKGILQRNLQLSEEDAYLTLQRESRQRRKSMKEVAEAIVLSEDLKKKR